MSFSAVAGMIVFDGAMTTEGSGAASMRFRHSLLCSSLFALACAAVTVFGPEVTPRPRNQSRNWHP